MKHEIKKVATNIKHPLNLPIMTMGNIVERSCRVEHDELMIRKVTVSLIHSQSLKRCTFLFFFFLK
jgi:hypothetical protein